jgi:regulator of RNase E activity RraA
MLQTINLVFLSLVAAAAFAQNGTPPFSQQFLKAKQYSREENTALVKQFQGLRLTDVVDALDVAGLQDITVMDSQIRPLWRDEQKFTHRIYGVAMTLRLVPAQERAPAASSPEEFDKWKADWSRRLVRGATGLVAQIQPDSILVVDASRTREVGYCGSTNTLKWYSLGLRGVVTDGGCRDSDELILEKLPVYQREHSTRGIVQGRMALESYNNPVNVGGVLVMPGDIIVADTDGVAVVPRAKAEALAAIARKIQDDDNRLRRELYEKLKRPFDFTIK